MYEAMLEKLRADYESCKILAGVFGAKMDVSLVNDGPVTIPIDTRKWSYITPETGEVTKLDRCSAAKDVDLPIKLKKLTEGYEQRAALAEKRLADLEAKYHALLSTGTQT